MTVRARAGRGPAPWRLNHASIVNAGRPSAEALGRRSRRRRSHPGRERAPGGKRGRGAVLPTTVVDGGRVVVARGSLDWSSGARGVVAQSTEGMDAGPRRCRDPLVQPTAVVRARRCRRGRSSRRWTRCTTRCTSPRAAHGSPAWARRSAAPSRRCRRRCRTAPSSQGAPARRGVLARRPARVAAEAPSVRCVRESGCRHRVATEVAAPVVEAPARDQAGAGRQLAQESAWICALGPGDVPDARLVEPAGEEPWRSPSTRIMVPSAAGWMLSARAAARRGRPRACRSGRASGCRRRRWRRAWYQRLLAIGVTAGADGSGPACRAGSRPPRSPRPAGRRRC